DWRGSRLRARRRRARYPSGRRATSCSDLAATRPRSARVPPESRRAAGIEGRPGFAGAPRTLGGFGGPYRGPPILEDSRLFSGRGLDRAEVLVDVAAEDAGHLARAHGRGPGE